MKLFSLCCPHCGPCGTYCVTVPLCCGDSPAGTTVTLSSGGTTVATGTTNALGVVCLGVPSAGTYTRTISRSGYGTLTTSVSLTCTTTNVTVNLDVCIAGTVLGCNGDGVVSGATVEIYRTSDGVTAVSTTTDGSGHFCCHAPILASGSYRIRINATRFATFDGIASSVAHSAPTYSVTYTMTAGAGYTCCFGCGTPVANTLYITILGTTITLTNSGGTWSGCGIVSGLTGYTYNSAGIPSFGTISAPFRVTYDCETVTIIWATNSVFGLGGSTQYPTLYYYTCPPSTVAVATTLPCTFLTPGNTEVDNVPVGCQSQNYSSPHQYVLVNRASVSGIASSTTCSPYYAEGTATSASDQSITSIPWAMVE